LKEKNGQLCIELDWLDDVLANKSAHFFYSFFELCTTTKFWSSNKTLFGEERQDWPDAEELFIDEVLRDESDVNAICTEDETKKLTAYVKKLTLLCTYHSIFLTYILHIPVTLYMLCSGL
jgi:hypothetical protein